MGALGHRRLWRTSSIIIYRNSRESIFSAWERLQRLQQDANWTPFVATTSSVGIFRCKTFQQNNAILGRTISFQTIPRNFWRYIPNSLPDGSNCKFSFRIRFPRNFDIFDLIKRPIKTPNIRENLWLGISNYEVPYFRFERFFEYAKICSDWGRIQPAVEQKVNRLPIPNNPVPVFVPPLGIRSIWFRAK